MLRTSLWSCSRCKSGVILLTCLQSIFEVIKREGAANFWSHCLRGVSYQCCCCPKGFQHGVKAKLLNERGRPRVLASTLGRAPIHTCTEPASSAPAQPRGPSVRPLVIVQLGVVVGLAVLHGDPAGQDRRYVVAHGLFFGLLFPLLLDFPELDSCSREGGRALGAR